MDNTMVYEDQKFSIVRKIISKSMKNSLDTTAQLTHHFSYDATSIKAQRESFKEQGGEESAITLGDMVVYAVSRTLSEFPEMNAHIVEENVLRKFQNINIGVAVDTPKGLMVPIVLDADKKSLLEISKEIKEMAEGCNLGKIDPGRLQGGTFTVSNLGSFGVEMFTPIINPPQVGIIGVCTITERPRTGKDGKPELYPAMGMSLTYDHRAIDGAPASRFMQAVCKNLENFKDIL